MCLELGINKEQPLPYTLGINETLISHRFVKAWLLRLECSVSVVSNALSVFFPILSSPHCRSNPEMFLL